MCGGFNLCRFMLVDEPTCKNPLLQNSVSCFVSSVSGHHIHPWAKLYPNEKESSLFGCSDSPIDKSGTKMEISFFLSSSLFYVYITDNILKAIWGKEQKIGKNNLWLLIFIPFGYQTLVFQYKNPFTPICIVL